MRRGRNGPEVVGRQDGRVAAGRDASERCATIVTRPVVAAAAHASFGSISALRTKDKILSTFSPRTVQYVACSSILQRHGDGMS